MKNPARKITFAIILGFLLFDAGFSFAQNNPIICNDKIIIYASEDNDSEQRKREFWEKFRETVKPREPPHEAEHPREVHPREVHPHEE